VQALILKRDSSPEVSIWKTPMAGFVLSLMEAIKMKNNEHKYLVELWSDLKNQKLTEGQFLLKAKEKVSNDEALAFIREQRELTERLLGMR
jgi:hypothetical protein